MMNLRLTLALGAITLAAATPAAAQFTTVVAPPKRVVEAQQLEARAQASAAARDTGHRATLQAMSAWVDSVAGAPAPGTVTADSASGDVVTDSASATTSGSRATAGTTRFQDGARAPNTASPLPLLLVAGLGAMLIGAAMLLTSRRVAPADARRRRAP